MIFELLATICIDAVCLDRLLPSDTVQSQSQCQARLADAADWASMRSSATLTQARCVPLSALADRAAGVVEVAPGTFVHEGVIEEPSFQNAGDTSNHGFVIGSDSVAVIDAGYTRAIAEALYIAVRRQTDKPISHVVFTHMHPDHTLGGDVFIEAGAQPVAAVKFQQAYDSRSEGYLDGLFRLTTPDANHGTYGLLGQVQEVDAMVIDLGERRLTLTGYPTAHTTNDLTVLDQTADVIWVGDLAFLTHLPALDGSISGWITLLEDLAQADAAQLIPGHGPAIAGLPEGFEPTARYLQALARITREAIARGDSLQTVLRNPGIDQRGDWQLFDVHHRRNATNAYVELEWE